MGEEEREQSSHPRAPSLSELFRNEAVLKIEDPHTRGALLSLRASGKTSVLPGQRQRPTQGPRKQLQVTKDHFPTALPKTRSGLWAPAGGGTRNHHDCPVPPEPAGRAVLHSHWPSSSAKQRPQQNLLHKVWTRGSVPDGVGVCMMPLPSSSLWRFRCPLPH